MNNFEYVPKAKALVEKKKLIKLINLVQNDIRNEFTFSFDFIGSSSRNMITYDPKTNVGYDFDVNIFPNINQDDYKPKKIKQIFMNSFNKFVKQYGYSNCEDSTRVFTIKVKDTKYK